jgi:hypothetical protein
VAARLLQPVLPWLPADAAEIAPGVGLVRGEDGSGTVWVHGLATFAWDAGDEAGRRLAAVQLARLGAARQNQVAAAFGTDPVTIWRWDQALAGGGVGALVPARRGPKGPSKLTPELAEKIRALHAGGQGRERIAAACGVSEFTVRNALGLIRKPAGPAAGAGGDTRPGGRNGGGEPPGAGEAGGPAAGPEAPGQLPLPVLPGPVARDDERALARFGLLGEGAAPVFAAGARYPLAGLLLALPALAQTGLLESARQVYARLRSGFYGLEIMLVALVFLALLREPRAEGATRVPPAALGRVLGLDRAPEVKTIRRKLGELAVTGKAADLQMAIARHHAATRPDELAFLYIDGHTRAYFGTRGIRKMHRARLKLPGPGTEETWVTDGRGDPLLVVIGEPSQSLAAQVKDLLPRLRQIAGDGAKPVLCFDRGGWSPDLFAEITGAGFDFMTWRRKDAGKDIPDVPDDEFSAASWTGDGGKETGYDLADTGVQLTVTSGRHKGRVLKLRQVTRREPARDGTTRQVHILTTRDRELLPAAGVAYKMSCRWREENWFRYGRAHFALDALDSYAVTSDDMNRKVPNPAKKAAAAQVKNARTALARAAAARDARLAGLRSPAPGTPVTITNQMLARLDAPAEAARRKLEAAQDAAKKVPAKIPLGQHNPAQVRLDAETKLITHAIRMAAFNAEVILARALGGSYPRAGDEALALIREALAGSGDIIPSGGQLLVRLDPLSAPRRTRALAALCDQLTQAGARYPGTGLVLRYEVKDHTFTA